MYCPFFAFDTDSLRTVFVARVTNVQTTDRQVKTPRASTLEGFIERGLRVLRVSGELRLAALFA